jgi:DNA-binding beta-propeller fold protein YncE
MLSARLKGLSRPSFASRFWSSGEADVPTLVGGSCRLLWVVGIGGGRPLIGRGGQLIACWQAVVAGFLCALILLAGAASAASAAPFAYVANNGSSDVSAFSIGPDGGLTALPGSPFTVAPATSPVGVAVSPDGAHLYATNAGSHNVSAFAIGPGGGLTGLPGSPFTVAPGISPVGVAVSPDGAHLYVTNRNSNNVSAFSIGPGGGLTAVKASPFTVAPGANPERVAVTPNGANLYVTNSGTNDVSAFSIGPGGGLTAVKGSPFSVAPPVGRFPFGVAVSPDGARLYVTNSSSDNVSAFSIGPGGGLTALPASPFPAGTEPVGVAVSPDGANLYVVNGNVGNGPGNVSAFSIGPGGGLTAFPGPPFPAGTNSNEVAVSPDGAQLYVTNGGSNNVSAFSIGPGGGLTAIPASPFTVAPGANPIGVAITPLHRLTVSKNGSGSGTATSSPSGIDCGGTCSARFAAGSMVTLTATPDSGSTFAGWSGAGCSGTGTCMVTMGSDRAATAAFTAQPPPPQPPSPSGCPDPAGAYNQGFNAGFTSGSNAAANSGVQRNASPAQPLPPACNPLFNQGFSAGFNSGLRKALMLTNVSQSHRRWRPGRNLARFAAAAKPPVGTTFQFTLNKAATVRFTFDELLPGRTVNKVNGKCVAQTAHNRRHKACTRRVPRGSLSFSAGAGVHRLFFQGRLTRTRKLMPGTYALTITATDAAGHRATKTLSSFTIVLR